MQSTVLYTVKDTEMKETWVLPSRNLVSHRRDDMRTFTVCGLLDISAKEVQPNPAFVEFSTGYNPLVLKGSAVSFWISLYQKLGFLSYCLLGCLSVHLSV